MARAPPVLLIALSVLAASLVAGCMGDDTSLPDRNQPGLFEHAAGVDVVVRNEGVTARSNVTIEVVNPSGDVAHESSLDVPAGAERGLKATVREEGAVRVVVTAQDYGGGKAEGTGNPFQCPGGARLTYTFTLATDVTQPPAFDKATCGHG